MIVSISKAQELFYVGPVGCLQIDFDDADRGKRDADVLFTALGYGVRDWARFTRLTEDTTWFVLGREEVLVCVDNQNAVVKVRQDNNEFALRPTPGYCLFFPPDVQRQIAGYGDFLRYGRSEAGMKRILCK